MQLRVDQRPQQNLASLAPCASAESRWIFCRKWCCLLSFPKKIATASQKVVAGSLPTALILLGPDGCTQSGNIFCKWSVMAPTTLAINALKYKKLICLLHIFFTKSIDVYHSGPTTLTIPGNSTTLDVHNHSCIDSLLLFASPKGWDRFPKPDVTYGDMEV